MASRCDDPELVRDALAGSRDALGLIFERHWPRVWRAAYAVSNSREIADEAAQDAFLRARAALHRYNPSLPLGPWLAKIAVNRARDILRSERRRETVTAEPSRTGDRGQLTGDLLAVLSGLPRERREAIILHYLIGYSIREVAEVLETSPGTVSSRIARGLNQLRAELEVDSYAG